VDLPKSTTNAAAQIMLERERQMERRKAGRFTHTCDDPEMSIQDCLLVLVREVGEFSQEVPTVQAAHSIHGSGDILKMRDECIQVGAVALATVEKLNRMLTNEDLRSSRSNH
jgi:hypothetical protein